MSKRQRDAGADVDAVRRAIELVCQRPVNDAKEESGAATTALTPLEKQVVNMKMSLPRDVVLMVACGYRVKFYGRDSRVASRRLGIMCINTTPFESSSVPYVRANLYIHRLVAMGYRVAFADQENASIRAECGTAKGIFAREVSRVYSRGSLLPSEVVGGTANLSVNSTAVSSADRVDATEDGGGTAGDVSFSPEDEENETIKGFSNLKEGSSELFMCFVCSSPSSLNHTATTTTSSTPHGAAAMDVTLVSFVTYDIARYQVRSDVELLDILHRYDIVELIVFHHQQEEDILASPLSFLQSLPEAYVSVLNAVLPIHFGPTCNGEEDRASVPVCAFRFAGSMNESIIKFLVQYRLDGVYQKMLTGDTKALSLRGSADSTIQKMELPGSTLSALDIFFSSIGTKGSLMALLDHTITLPGMRRLRVWLSNPFSDINTILLRQKAVSFLLERKEDNNVTKLLRECSRFGDVEAILGKIRAQRCTVEEYLCILRAIDTAFTLATEILSRYSDDISPIIHEALVTLSSTKLKIFLDSCRCEIESQATSPLEYFTASGKSTPVAMQIHLTTRDKALSALDEELEHARKILSMPALEYRTIGGTPFVLDVPQAKCNRVPKDWLVLTRTKTHVRFHTLNIVNFNVSLCSARERLLIAANEAWQEKQEQLINCSTTLNYFRSVIDAIADLDALHSLAVASSAPGYVAPMFLSDTEECLIITGGRHPVLDRITRGGYVSCDVRLMRGGAWVLTGPNMGGKSALMRMVGTFIIMAQLGCHVPATSAQLPVFTAVFCRMGASDSILEGSSTFLREMEETSRILCSPRVSSSLVLLDELGRGTSSFDGIAIAAATLEYLLKQRATTLFVTHYSHLCEPYLNSLPNERVSCYYMGFREEKADATDGMSRLVFTYEPVRGVTPSSFGVRVARMAGLPSRVVAEAQRLSEKVEKEHTTRMALTQLRSFVWITPEVVCEDV